MRGWEDEGTREGERERSNELECMYVVVQVHSKVFLASLQSRGVKTHSLPSFKD